MMRDVILQPNYISFILYIYIYIYTYIYIIKQRDKLLVSETSKRREHENIALLFYLTKTAN